MGVLISFVIVMFTAFPMYWDFKRRNS